MGAGTLSGNHVVVAGAGLAGLTAARDLEAAGARVTVVEARDRIGGRVHTYSDGFAGGQHAEAGADLIEGEQSFVHELISEVGLKAVRILRHGFSYYGPDRSGRRRIGHHSRIWGESARRLKEEISDYCLVGKRWDSAVAQRLAGQSVAEWLQRIQADDGLVAGMRGLRGYFLADPEDLSLIAVVDQFASGDSPGRGKIYRIKGGNGLLPHTLASALRGNVRLRSVVLRIAQNARGVRVTLDERGTQREIVADFCVATLPASTLRDVAFEPDLPEDQFRAIATLGYGAATRMLLQFERPFWRKPGRPLAFGSDLPTGSLWDGAEEQRTGPGILSLLAGGRASRELRGIVATEGVESVVGRLSWLGKPARLLATHTVTWEKEEWSRGGYAVFTPSFDPRLREWLARPAGRLVFAGEHTSLRWQGFMNGAIESGRRAAAEVRALASV